MSVAFFQRVRQRPEFSPPIMVMLIGLFVVSAAIARGVPYPEYVPPELYMTAGRFHELVAASAALVDGRIVRNAINRQDSKTLHATTWIACDQDRADLVAMMQPLLREAMGFKDSYCENSSTSSSKVLYEFQRPNGFLRLELDVDSSPEWQSRDAEESGTIHVRLDYTEYLQI